MGIMSDTMVMITREEKQKHPNIEDIRYFKNDTEIVRRNMIFVRRQQIDDIEDTDFSDEARHDR